MPRGGVPAVARKAAVASDASALVAAAKLGGKVGFVLADARDGTVIEAMNGAVDLPPASVAKTITSLYALDRLGAGFRFDTRLIATGPVQDGVIAGDLVLAGSGDPTLSTDMLGDMAAALKARGVKGVRGRFLVFGGALPSVPRIDGDQPDHVGYNPAISGLNLNFNRVYFGWKQGTKGYDVVMDARAERFVPAVAMARMKVMDRDLPVYTYARGVGVDNWTVARGALGKGGGRWLPVRHPEFYAAEVFHTLARAQGITLPAAKSVAALPAGTVLVSHKSDDLSGILRDMLKYSTNITAEVIGMTASGGQVASLAASARKMTEWATERHELGARFIDHSGLGAASRMAAQDMVRALVAARGGPLRGLLKDIPLRDAKGRPVKSHPVKVAGKTGTLNFVSGLAGYITTPSGKELAFAIFCADVTRRDGLPMEDREVPPGGRQWAGRARLLQSRLIEQWAEAYG